MKNHCGKRSFSAAKINANNQFKIIKPCHDFNIRAQSDYKKDNESNSNLRDINKIKLFNEQNTEKKINKDSNKIIYKNTMIK